ncbi:peptidyl-tRNA hydrolase [Saccharopolyspora lacisalsi]|uniref:peptidyl-tRNA hydrolase n=1 Tax=Halosaccharopolyspora lacisalsi TaxID=1000566 RepID=A0A839DM92_9PSEU|nr:aminoacyl-tRNA hydrolase [Halosaccharopolyspora lacisalsi]MBA8823082.1 peptidyl-tRNA hydrolase [Halosaccharopolyspora lacisalsi]
MTDAASVLEPLAARYASWLRLSEESTADTSDEDPDTVVLMPMVLRIERAEPPRRTALLEAAATAALAVCLDERCAPGGEWHEAVHAWTSGRIRKVTRRARGSHWNAVQSLPGITVNSGDAEVRALLPMRVADMPRQLTRLQISGSELEHDEPDAVPEGVPTLWLNPGVEMSAGKAAAQVGHASMILAALLHADGLGAELERWSESGLRCAVRAPGSDSWQRWCPRGDPETAWSEHRIATVRDAGFTEVDPGTVTVLAQWPR